MTRQHEVAIVDYGMGNLFSVEAACAHWGMRAVITSDPDEIENATTVILPGVGAFSEAMRRLSEKSLDEALRRFARSGRPFFAICLGMQLLFNESEEFGLSPGLSLLPGRVVRFPGHDETGASVKVPAIGWNQVRLLEGDRRSDWRIPPMASIGDAEYFYFVHSYYVQPEDPGLVLTRTRYAGVDYASSLAHQNIFACQFHPERSGPAGLQIYRNLAATIRRSA